jgi:hypothetical protein
MDTALNVHRLHFALTIIYHYADCPHNILLLYYAYHIPVTCQIFMGSL